MILLLLSACSPFGDLEDRWNQTWEICDPDALSGRPDPYDLNATLSADCQERLLDDLHVDRDSLDEAPTSETAPPLASCLALSGFVLLSRDGGDLGDAPERTYAVYEEQLQGVLEVVGGQATRKLTYDYTTGLILGITWDPELPAGALAMTMEDGLHVSSEIGDECGLELGHLLFHEAGHRDLEGHVACAADPSLACDVDDQGTFALEASLLGVWAETAEDEDERAYLEAARDAAAGRMGG